MTEYIWIVGHSAVGKESFIRKLVESGNAELRSGFGIRGVAEAYGHGPSFVNFDSVQDLIGLEAAQVLIKWQWGHEDYIVQLRDAQSDCLHRVLVLWRPPADVLRARLERKPDDKGALLEMVQGECDSVAEYFRKIAEAGIRVEWVNASGWQYQKMNSWPQ